MTYEIIGSSLWMWRVGLYILHKMYKMYTIENGDSNYAKVVGLLP